MSAGDANTELQYETPNAPRGQSFSLYNVLILVVPVALIIVGVFAWFWNEANREGQAVPRVGPSLKYTVKSPEKLDPRVTDADGDLVADAPKDPREWIDPETLVFSTLGPRKDDDVWADFIVHLKKVTGKKEVKLVQKSYDRKDQFEEIAKGDVHILAISTGAVPAAVNLGGFVPYCVMADSTGKWGYQMEIIVPASSEIKSLADLRGKTIAIANFASHSGFKLLVVTLWDNGLRYEWDYKGSISGGQSDSIQAVRAKRCSAAGVASDFLKRQLAAGKIAASEYRTIYTSPLSYPPACFGYPHNLKPELAEKIKKAFLEFNWAGTSLEQAYKDANQVKFVPISYKTDWEGIRQTEKRLLERADEQQNASR